MDVKCIKISARLQLGIVIRWIYKRGVTNITFLIMLKLSHKKLDVWTRSIDLVKEIYRITDDFPESEKFGLTSQLRRAAISVVSNITEGAARYSDADKARFYEIARSSLVEIDAQIQISFELNFIGTNDIVDLTEIANEIFAKLSKLRKTRTGN